MVAGAPPGLLQNPVNAAGFGRQWPALAGLKWDMAGNPLVL